VRSTRIIGRISVLVLFGAVARDLANDGLRSRHGLFASLLASVIVVAVTVAVLNEVRLCSGSNLTLRFDVPYARC
jgi:hypothetical protein